MPTEPLPDDLGAIPIRGRNLVPGSLRDQWGDAPTLIVFLRHLGCIFCREFIAELKAHRATHPEFPETIYVHPATVEQGDAFFAAEVPDAKAVADPEHRLYEAFGVKKGSLGQVFGPGAIACGIRAFSQGHRQGKLAGDPWLMPGYRLVGGDAVIYRFEPRNIGEHPDLDAIGRAAANADAKV